MLIVGSLDLRDLEGALSLPPPPVETLMHGNFKLVRLNRNREFALIEHVVTQTSKWVRVMWIRQNGILEAYYDADPTYQPEGEKP